LILLQPLKHPLDPLKASNSLKERRKKLKKIPVAMRALRGKIRGAERGFIQSKKLSKERRYSHDRDGIAYGPSSPRIYPYPSP
jgi:hypothetical protein